MNAGPRRDIPELDVADDDRIPLELDDAAWDTLLPDEDQREPLPEPGDFWIEPDDLATSSAAA